MSGTSMAREYEAIEPALAAARNQGGTRCCMSGRSMARGYEAIERRWLVSTGQWALSLLHEDEAIEPALAVACERQVDGS